MHDPTNGGLTRFGRPRNDSLDIMAALSQCCLIRPAFLRTLLRFYEGPVSLAQALHESLKVRARVNCRPWM